MHVSDRQVRTYRTMSEQLTEPEKVDLAAGTLKFGEAQNIAVERAAKATQPTVANATKNGSTSAFSSKTESTKSSLSPEMREDLLRKVIMSGYIWNCEDLLDYYVEMMPTPQEAVKDILKPKYGYHGGTLIMKHFNGSYECTSSKLILQNGAMQTIAAYTYNEADTMIRKLYRDGELCPERQDAK